LAVWDDSGTEFMEVLVRMGAVELKDGTFRIRDYFRDKLRRSVPAQAPDLPQAGPPGEGAGPAPAS
jgi:hypothetical protein